MYKLVTFSGYDTSGPHIFPIDPDVDQTIGHIKMARPLPPSIEQYIRTAKSVPGKTQLLIDAMGAGEFYGCFPPGTLIQTAHGEVPIESIEPGNQVLTHLNRFRPVRAVLPQKADELCDVFVQGLPSTHPALTATPGHELWAVLRDDFIRTKRKVIWRGDTSSPLAERRDAALREVPFSWVAISDLRAGDMIAEPFPLEEDPLALGDAKWNTPEVAFLMGLYAAEGCVAYRYDRDDDEVCKIVYVTGRHETETHRRATECALVVGHKMSPQALKRDAGTTRMELCFKELAQLCLDHIGSPAEHKRLSSAVLRMPLGWQETFFNAYAGGDGCVRGPGSGKEEGSIRCVSASAGLLRGFRIMLARRGIAASISGRHNTKATWYSGRPIFELMISAGQANGERGCSKSYIHPSGYILSSVKKTRTYDWNGDVFDLSVEEDASYVASGVAVHNSNVNGDYFTEASLRADGPDFGHKTFELYAYPFKHHCFPAGTLVTMANRERVSIDELQVGDVVATLDGPRPVTAIMRRPYKGDGISLRLSGQYEQLVATADHPVQVFRRAQIHCRCKYSRLTDSAHAKDCLEYRQSIGDPSWEPISSIEPGDYLVVPKPALGGIAAAPAFARLVGWVASEGCLGQRGSIQFTFSEKNLADIESVMACLKENGLHVTTTPRPQTACVMLTTCSKELSAQLSEYTSGKLSEKALTGKILEWDVDSIKQMLGAFIDGDGHVPSTGRNRGQLRIRSSSPQMLNLLADAIRAVGCPATIQWDVAPGGMVSPTNGQTYHSSGSGVVAVGSGFAPMVTLYSRKHFVRANETATSETRLGNVYLVKVTETDRIDIDEEVFNLEVEGAHHYLANEVVVHNCNKDPARAYGEKVTLSAYDPYMHRVLLIVSVDDAKCQDILGDLAANKYWDVSMGCRVPWDECSICRNRAKNRAEYCPHLRYQMNKILQDGRRVFAYNHLPKFFDISFVTIGAEKASHVLKKVASASSTPNIISSAMMGELFYGKLAAQEKGATQLKEADIDKDVPSQPGATASGVTPEDKSKLLSFMNAAGEVKGMEAPIPPPVLDRLSEFPLESVFSTLASLGIGLRPQEFQRIVLIKQGARALANQLELKRLVFDETKVAAVTPQWAKRMGAFSVDHLNEKVAMILAPYIRERSCYPEILHERLRRMEKRAGDVVHNRNSQWYPMTDEQKRKASGINGLVPASLALAAGFSVFNKAFPELMAKAPMSIQTLGKHPWMLPLLLGAGIASSVGASTMMADMPIQKHGSGSVLDAKNTRAYHEPKIASVARLGLIPLSYMYSGIQQKRWQRGEQLNALDRMIALRPELLAVGSFLAGPSIVGGIKGLAKGLMKSGSESLDDAIINTTTRLAGR